MISIIVPVYNVKDYVVKCLQAISNQSFADYEVIVVDDGSTDGSSQLVDTFCEGRANFRVFHKQNGGLMSAWMHGVKQAQGDYLGFVDSDDYPAVEMFETMYTAAKEKNADIVYCDYYAMEGNNVRIVTTPNNVIREGLYHGNDIKAVYNKILPSLTSGCISNARWNKIFRKDLFMLNTRYCECMSKTFEDRYIVPACVFSAKSFLYIKKPLYYYLHREFSNCGKPSETLLDDIKRMNECQRKALEDKGLLEEYKTYWENARIDSLKQFIKRNILGYGTKELAKKSARMLINDKEYCELINKYRKQLLHNGKQSALLAIASATHIPGILVAGRLFTKRKYKS